ncbi:hypothetical protein BJF93_19070 [Xaviernesmea oryzae]|uniref:Alpha/beta hydrolase n=1 Tax=Xaviernesmea oryzae TaxID=464029 RepID=A0A1Q9B1L4_9HYPH|nr:alpha/beta hydrolase [Xaviernesmea oryzae]OLP61907.1 hypothetical protein BJF93_19070 [Xaviernesmea oryzae]SEL77012.1 hypothetical protein SAMN04487976_112126 [Xaviernesmea oryzae]
MSSTLPCQNTLILPGLFGSPEAHWQRHWARDRADSRVVEQADWDHPHLAAWLARLEEAIAAQPCDVWLVAHSLGCVLAAKLAERPLRARVRGALLVAPCDLETAEALHPDTILFGAMPRQPLPFPTLVVGSLDDPYMPLDRLRRTAQAWDAGLQTLGRAGHINIASGYGRWTAGYGLLDRLKAAIEPGDPARAAAAPVRAALADLPNPA